MNLILNGNTRAYPPLAALSDLLQHLQLDPTRVAIEHNGSIVPQASFAATSLNDGDRLEIVQFVGGG